MTEFEKKADEIRQSAEQAKAEAQAAKSEAAAAVAEAKAAKEELAKREAELKTAQDNIDNLDKSVKEQAESLKAMKAALDATTIRDFKSAFRAELEAKKPEMEKMFKAGTKNFTISIELKDVYSIGTGMISPNNRLSVAEDPTIHADVPVANTFIAAFGISPRTTNKLGWVEASSQPVVDYVAELAENTNKSDVSFVEKTRAFGKLGTWMQISTEFEDWFEKLYDFCVNEGQAMILAKLDAEIANGAGADGTYPNKIYGIWGQATAFDALAAGKVKDANIADVLMDAAHQIAKAGYNANVAILTWGDYVALKAAKDDNGNYLFDQVRSILAGMRVMVSERLSAGQALIADTNCAKPYAGNSYELEFIRNGALDAYDVYYRKAAQVKVTTPQKKGLIKVASIATAKAALLETAGSGSGSGSGSGVGA